MSISIGVFDLSSFSSGKGEFVVEVYSSLTPDEDDDADVDHYEGIFGMSPEIDEDEAEDRCPVPGTESDSSDSDSEARETVPQDRVV